ncbi:MAG: T9SS type A sorting domain-containing protein [Saprospiraceae bacterium]|nr:T9SS type A sorting domain-containing protein [Saprospiraceae bacterium]
MKRIKNIKLHNKSNFYLIVFIFYNVCSAQSVSFNYSSNGNIVKKELDIDKKDYTISGDSIACKGKDIEYIISTNESAIWNNGVNGNKSKFTIIGDTLIKAIVTNKFGCQFEKVKDVKAVDLPPKPVITKLGDSLIVLNVNGEFEWYRNGTLFSVGLNFIRTSLNGSYTAKIINQFDCANLSDPYLLTVTEESEQRSIVAFPNPTSGILYIDSKLSDNMSFLLFSLDGKRYDLKLLKNSLDISRFPNGVYILIVQSSNSRFQMKVMKI